MNTNSQKTEKNVAGFYDKYWPVNVPDYKITREHIFSLMPANKQFQSALDGGCGSGVCTLSLAEKVGQVTAVDISEKCVANTLELAKKLDLKNVTGVVTSLLSLPFENEKFDFVLSWGVVHHTTDPIKAITELTRVLKPGGTIVLAIYWRTMFTFVHETARKMCLKMSPSMKKTWIKSCAGIIKFAEMLGKKTVVRDDNITIESQVEDWFFVPEKHFYTPEEMQKLFDKLGLEFELLCKQTGRFKSSSNFIVRGAKR